jgi:hypothetical protein
MKQAWYITDMWEEIYAVPVTIEAVDGHRAAWHLGEGIYQYFTIHDLSDIFETQEEAELEAAHRNALKIANKNN